MAVAWKANGTAASSATITTISPAMPATVDANDIAFALLLNKGASTTTISAPDSTWTQVVQNSNGATQRIAIFWKRCVGTEDGASVTFTKSVDDNLLFYGTIVTFSGCKTHGSPIDDTTPTFSANASSDTVTYATFDPAETAAHVVAVGFYNDDATTAGAIAGTDPAFTNRLDIETGTGTDGSIFLYEGASSGVATGARSHSTTSGVDAINIGVLFGLIAVPTDGYFWSAAGVGASSATDGGSAPTPALPSGLVAGDLMVTTFYSREATDGTVSISAGWTQIVNTRGTGGLIAVWWRRYVGGDSAPTFTLGGHAAGDTAIAQICKWTGAVQDGSPVWAVSVVSNNASAQNILVEGMTGIRNDCLVLMIGGKADDWTFVSKYTSPAANPPPASQVVKIDEVSSTLGNDAGLVWGYALGGVNILSWTLGASTNGFAVTGGGAAVSASVAIAFAPADDFVYLEPGGDATDGLTTFSNSTGSPTASATAARTGSRGFLFNPASGASEFVVRSNAFGIEHGQFGFSYRAPTLSLTHGIFNFQTSGATRIVRIIVESDGTVQLVRAGDVLLAESAAGIIQSGRWYSFRLCYNITSTTVNEFRLYVEDTTTGGITTVSASNVTIDAIPAASSEVLWGRISTVVGTQDIWIDDMWCKQEVSLTDPGDILVTYKAPSGSAVDSFDTGIGTGSQPGSLIERPISETNGRSQAATTQASETYSLESLSSGEEDLTGATIKAMGLLAWANNATTSYVGSPAVWLDGTAIPGGLTTSTNDHGAFAATSTYPTGKFGLRSTGTAEDTNLYELYGIIAYSAAPISIRYVNRIVRKVSPPPLPVRISSAGI